MKQRPLVSAQQRRDVSPTHGERFDHIADEPPEPLPAPQAYEAETPPATPMTMIADSTPHAPQTARRPADSVAPLSAASQRLTAHRTKRFVV